MEIATDGLEVEHNVAASRFEVRSGGELSRLEYRMSGSAMVITHTVVPPALERHGIAGLLARHALDFARERGMAVVPLCPYVREYVRTHPEYTDLVVARERWKEYM